MGVDREATVKKADDLAREGKLELAIEEYRRVVDDQPGDLGAANALGDLYAKTGNKTQAVAQFVQIGDHHRETGFIPKAVAFYKKALKVDPASDQALSQLAQIAVDQELYADATLYLNRLLQQRREQKNDAGAAECVVRLGSFPTANADTKIGAARAAADHYPPARTAQLWMEAADALERAGRPREALDALFEASSLDAGDVAIHRRIALACAQTGQIDRAGAFLSRETAGDHPDLLLALAERAIREGRDEEARRALQHTIHVAPDRRLEAEALLAPLMPATHATIAAARADAVEDEGVEIAFDAAFEEGPPLTEAAPPPATFVLEPTSLTAPALPEPIASVEPPMIVEPEAPAEGVTLHAGGGDGPLPATSAEPEWSDLVLDEENRAETDVTVDPVTSDQSAPIEPASGQGSDAAVLSIEAEVPSVDVEPATGPAAETSPAPVVESHAAAPAVSSADADAIAALTAAAENPALQFQASAQLGRLLLRQGRLDDAIAWFERATLATGSVREQRLDVLYELADTLERHGSLARALDVFADLEFDAASYRDVPDRMARLRGVIEGRAT